MTTQEMITSAVSLLENAQSDLLRHVGENTYWTTPRTLRHVITALDALKQIPSKDK